MKINGNKIVLNKRECFLSKNSEERFVILSGSIRVNIVPWYEDGETGETGRSVVFIPAIKNTDEIEIPAFFYKQEEHSWCFSFQAVEDHTIIEVAKSGVTKLLQKRFLRWAGVNDEELAAEGSFEGVLKARYSQVLAREAGTLEDKRNQNIHTQRRIFSAIAGSFLETSGTEVDEGSLLYRTVFYAAKKCGIEKVASEKTVIDQTGKQEIDVIDIARVSGFICRQVTLDNNWTKSDCGVIVAFIRSDPDKESKKPIVCYPESNHYISYDVTTKAKEKLTEKKLPQLEMKAYALRRVLPMEKLTRNIIIEFIKKSISLKEVVSLIFFSLICTIIGVLIPKMNQLIYDDYIPLGNLSLILQIGSVITSCMVGNIFISLVKSLIEYRIPCKAGYELQDAVYHRLFQLPEHFFRQYDSADLARRVMSIGTITHTILQKIISNGISILLSLVYWIQMFRYSKKLTGVSILMVISLAMIVYSLSQITLRIREKMAEYEGQASGKLLQIIHGIEKIKMAGAEERAVLEYSIPVTNEKQLDVKIERNEAVLHIFTDASSTVFSMILYYLMVKTKMNLSIGSFMAFTTAFSAATGTATQFIQALVEYSQLKPIIQRIKPILSEQPETSDTKDMISNLDGSVSINHVTFGYDKTLPPVLNDITIHINSGEYVALVGSSGCGKSTLLKLLLGFETTDHGEILYNGKDINSLDLQSLRSQIGVVLQNGSLIGGSIFENITVVAKNPDIEKTWQILEEVGLKSDVEAMPMQLHTVMNEFGSTISGGQMQRILIARAIYNDPPIVYFDEATSALDNVTQSKVCKSLEKRKMTRLVIAHRLSTVRECDRIIVIDHGSIVEEGTYEQLMNLKGQFYTMAQRQLI